MPLSPGARLGPYEIVSALGAGGMGEVYRGRDTRLDRSVAVKVMPPHLAATPEMRQRFELEARAISSLQHPHICALHDLGSHQGVDFLVMELLEGESLATRLARGPLPLVEVLRYGAQIADALSSAHRRGIIHRDLKPANVMLTREGVKLVDFGLARRVAIDPSAPESSQEMTRVAPLTGAGMILGTLHYMAPEQLEGRPADARADLFALGAVLYEMATGYRAFAGESAASVISAVLREHPPLVSSRIPLAPPALDQAIEHCLAKDPERRWESAHDLRLQLTAIAPTSAAATASRSALRKHRWLPWTVAALAVTAALLAWAPTLARAPQAAANSEVRFELSPPPGGRFHDTVEAVSMAISPDGSTLAFLGSATGGPRSVWLRTLDELLARPLAGTEGASTLFWSPDGRSLGFVAQGKLKRIDVTDGQPVVLCDVPTGIGLAATWGSRGTILFATVQGDTISRIDAGGGQPVAVVTASAATTQRVTWPWYLADGERFLYLAQGAEGSELRLVDSGGGSRSIAEISSRVEVIGDDWAVFSHDGALIAQRLDLKNMRKIGTPVPLAPAVRSFTSTGSASFATSRSGTVVLAAQGDASRLTWYSATGEVLATLGEAHASVSLSISPDGRRALTDRIRAEVGSYDLWMVDLERGVETRLTSDPGTETHGIWLPDNASVVYSASRGGPPQLTRRVLASGAIELLLPEEDGTRSRQGSFQLAVGATRGGDDLVFRQRQPSGGFTLWTVPLTSASARAMPLVSPEQGLGAAALSPDGTLLAFVSSESGRPEAYVRPMVGGETVRVSIDGAYDLRFARDGRRLYFVSPDGWLMAAAFSASPSLTVRSPTPLFRLPPLGWIAFDVAPDGRVLALATAVDTATAPRTVITGWRGE